MRGNKILFIDKNIKTDLSNNGFAKINPLSQDDISVLIALYNNTKSKKSENACLYVSSRECTLETSTQIGNTIKDLLQPYFDTIADNFDLYGGAFLSKPKLEKNEFSLHQDFTLIDKEKDAMYAIWIALQDTTIDNGCMYLIGKSHTLFENYISASYNNHKIHREKISSKHVTAIELKAGEGIIFGDDVFHGSYPNATNNERLAVTARITSRDAQFVYHGKADNNTCIQYKIAPQDLIQYFDEFQKGNIPKHIPEIKRFPYKHKPITERSLQTALDRATHKDNMTPYRRFTYSIRSYCNKILDSF